MKVARFLAAASGLVLSLPAVQAADWPQWRGPERNGISQEKGLLSEWPKEGPRLNWQVKDLGDGYSTPSIVGDHIYLIANKGIQDENALALSANDGRVIWTQRLGKVGPNTKQMPYPGARSTPTADGDRLYALGSDGDLVCLDAKTGQIHWQKSLRKDFGGAPGMWAYSESPLIDGDVLVCTPGGKTATIVALDKTSGKTIWKSPLPEADQAAYASVIVVTVGGIKQYVQFLQKGLAGVDASTGKLLWRYDKTSKSPANIPTAVAYQNYIYSASGRGGCGVVELKAKDHEVEAEPVYFNMKLPNAIGGSVEVGGFLYGTSAGGLQCVDFITGTQKWQNHGIGVGSICYADGRLYLHGEDKGDVALVECSSDGYHEKGRFSPPNPPEKRKGKAWAYPSIANGTLYIYDFGTLWSYNVKNSAAAVETRVLR
jgi:outer membrane protein assembly factor BamB